LLFNLLGRERLAAFESVPSCGLGYFGRVEYMLVSIPPSTFLDEVHHATPGSSFDEKGVFIAYWAIELMAGILIVLIVSPLRGRSVWGGGVCYRDVGPLGPSSQAAKQPSSTSTSTASLSTSTRNEEEFGLLPIRRPDGPEQPSSHRELLTKPKGISKPERQ
jgi:hypothetical protein